MSELCDNVCQNLESRKHRRKSLKSVCPSTIALWNDLPDEIRESDTMLSFKSRITPVVEKMPPYLEIAHRKLLYYLLVYVMFVVTLTMISSE